MEDGRAGAPPNAFAQGCDMPCLFPGYHSDSHGEDSFPLYLPGAPQPRSVKDMAKSALEMIGDLCRESGWRWIDGMLLGGCLAYGLEQYEKALDWYSKIIAIDSRYLLPSGLWKSRH